MIEQSELSLAGNLTDISPLAPYFTVVLPVYNEEETIGECVEDIITFLSGLNLDFEVLPVDDGSRDHTLEVLRELQKRYPQCLRVASHTSNKGNGAAVRTGIRMARGEIVIIMDADGQHRASYIPELLAHIPPFDMVVGARTESYRGAWYRNFANRFYNWFASWLTQRKIEDLTSGFRAVRRTVALHFLHLLPAGFSTPTTLTMSLLKAGYSVKFVPVEVRARTKGKSKINLWKDGQRFVTIMVRMIMIYNPMRIFIPVTLFLIFLGLLAMGAGILAAQRLVVPNSTVVLFIAAVLSILLGTVSSQIADVNVRYYGDEYVTEYNQK
jgi:glycosyltransferase involved in cell wall biosynthesis